MENYPWLDRILYPLFLALDESALAAWVKASIVIVPWAGVLHLLAIALLGGAVLMVDMRVLGAGLTSQSPAAVHRVVRPLLILALALAVISGSTLALGELMKLYYSPPYWAKMGSFAAALLFTFGVRNRIVAADGRTGPVVWILAVIAIAFWATVFVALSNTLARGALLALLAVLGLWAVLGGRAEGPATGWAARAASVTSIAMWLTVAASGRWIAFY